MKCYICDSENWHAVTINKDGVEVPIHSEMKLQVCKVCGNACHEIVVESEEKMREFYRKDYRPAPTVLNLLTTTHKQNYISAFLRDYLKDKKNMITGDVGCATGYLPAFFRKLGHRATGCEYTLTYRRFAEHYYGIPITEELEAKHKYNLITIYHVLEHMMEPDKKLKQYVDMLADDGNIFASTPQWLNNLEEASGTSVESFDHLFHKNHINIFTGRSLQNLFAKAGLEVVKEDHAVYGQTYLLKKAGEVKPAIVFENWEEVVEKMRTQYRAIELFQKKQHKEAIAIYPSFPEAWLNRIFVEASKDVDKQVDLFAAAEAACPGNLRVKRAKATWLYQNGKLGEALKHYQEICEIKPNEDDFMFMGYCLAQMGHHQQAIEVFIAASNMDPRKWQEAQNWACAEASKLQTWDERAVAGLKEQMFDQQKKNITINPRDPVMGEPAGA